MPPTSSRPRSVPVRIAAALALGASVGVAMARADVVTTREGLVLDGSVTTRADGSVVVTRDGASVVVEKARVLTVATGPGARDRLGRELAALPAADVEGRLRLALRAEAEGAASVARAAYESILVVDGDHPAARRALGWERVDEGWLPQTDARRRRGLVLFEGTWRLPAEADAAARAKAPSLVGADRSLADVLRAAATGEPLLAEAARDRLAAAPAAARAATATALLRDRVPAVRVVACATLAQTGDEVALRPLVESALADPDPAVRAAAVTAAASFGHDDTAVPFVRALGSSHPAVVVNAARALAALGDVRAIGYVVKRILSHGSSPRVVVEALTKTSYVRDYDVEIAQASNIANPQVGIVMDGIVFDVKVMDLSMDRVVVERTLLDTFNALAGAQARDAGDVLAWKKAHPEAEQGFPATPVTTRAARPSRHASHAAVR